MFLHLAFALLLQTFSRLTVFALFALSRGKRGGGGGGGAEATQNCFGKRFLGGEGRDRDS